MGMRGGARWVDRVQPWLGAVLLTLSGVVVLAAVERGDLTQAETFRQVGPAGFMGFAGLGMIFRNRARRGWLFLAGALVAAVALERLI